MKKKIFIAFGLAGIIGASLTAGAYAGANLEGIQAYLNKGINVTINGQAWQPKDSTGTVTFPITYNNTTWLPVKSIGDALGVKVGWDAASNSVLIGSNATEPQTTTDPKATPTPSPQAVLDGEKQVAKYLNDTYAKQTPLKTAIGDFNFTITVTENDSKLKPYDYLISFNFDLLDYYSKVHDNENSIKKGDQGKMDALTAREDVKKFIGTIAKDLNVKLQGKKLLGMTDSSYYTYPTIKSDFNVVQDFAWSNYDFVAGTDPLYADYYSPLTNYDETVLSTLIWAPDKTK